MIMRTRYLCLWHFHKIRKTDSAAFKKFHLCIKCQKHGEYIRKAEASPDTYRLQWRSCGTVRLQYGAGFLLWHLSYMYEVPDEVPGPAMGSYANHKFTFCFCDGIQTKPGKINGCGYNTVTHFSHTMPPSTQAVRFWFSS